MHQTKKKVANDTVNVVWLDKFCINFLLSYVLSIYVNFGASSDHSLICGMLK